MVNLPNFFTKFVLVPLCWLHRQGSPRKRKGPISGTKGMDRFRTEEAFYVNPIPDCLCHKEPPDMNASIIIR